MTRLGMIAVSVCAAIFSSQACAEDTVPKQSPTAADRARGELMIKRALTSDDPKDISAVGMMLFDGIGVPIDHPAAMPYLEKAAKLGRAEAQYRLGGAYSPGMNQKLYSDPPANPDLAAEWMARAAASAAPLVDSDPAAMMVMANLKFNGRGGVASDATGALALVKRAANLSYPEAETTLGNLLSADVRPPVDPIKLREAIDWYGKAVIVGSSEAMQGMGMAFLAIDEPEKAHPFLRRAASMGREYASRFLYLRFNEKVGNNIALEQDQILNKALERQKQRELIDRLTDPLAMAASILALSAIVGISVYDPDRKSDPKAEKGYQDYQRSTSGRANEAV